MEAQGSLKIGGIASQYEIIVDLRINEAPQTGGLGNSTYRSPVW